MKFIDFLKDKLGYIIIYFISLSLAVLIMYLTSVMKLVYFPVVNIAYAFFGSCGYIYNISDM